jgi:hypothetical protein
LKAPKNKERISVYRREKHESVRGKQPPDKVRRNIFTVLKYKLNDEDSEDRPVRKHTIAAIAAFNGVSIRTVYRYQKRIKDSQFKKDCLRSDYLKPKHRKLNQIDLECLNNIAGQCPDKSAGFIHELFKNQSNTKISRFTIWRFLKQHQTHLLNPINRLRKILGVNKKLAALLVKNGYDTIEEIKNSSAEEIFKKIYSTASRNKLNELDFVFFNLEKFPDK